MRYVLFNPLSANCVPIDKLARSLREVEPEEDIMFVDQTNDREFENFKNNLKKEDDIVVSGGDGTLNHIANKLDFDALQNRVFVNKAGNGNDFLRDLNELKEEYTEITQHLKNLPVVTINGENQKFLNGVGFGIDGMICVESSKLKAKGKKKINYKSLAARLLLFKYKKVNAVINVDGKEYNFKNVFMSSSMNGKYYCGAMKQAPSQDRNSATISLVVWHNFCRLSMLFAFSKVFDGKHILNKKHVTVLEGKEITVKYSKPTDIQIDGEAIHGISEYRVTKK